MCLIDNVSRDCRIPHAFSQQAHKFELNQMPMDDFYADREVISADESAKLLLRRKDLHHGAPRKSGYEMRR